MATVAECLRENIDWLNRENNSLDWYRNNLLEAMEQMEPVSISARGYSYQCCYRDATSRILSDDLSGWQILFETALIASASWEFQSNSISDETDDDILVDETLELTAELLSLALLSLQTSFHVSATMLRRFLDSVSRSEDSAAYFRETNAIPFCCWLILTMHGESHELLSGCSFGIYDEAANAIRGNRNVSENYLHSLCEWHLASNEYTDEGEVQVFRHHPFNFIPVEIYLLEKVLKKGGHQLPQIEHELLNPKFAIPDTLTPQDHRERLSARVAAVLEARSIQRFLSPY